MCKQYALLVEIVKQMSTDLLLVDYPPLQAVSGAINLSKSNLYVTKGVHAGSQSKLIRVSAVDGAVPAQHSRLISRIKFSCNSAFRLTSTYILHVQFRTAFLLHSADSSSLENVVR